MKEMRLDLQTCELLIREMYAEAKESRSDRTRNGRVVEMRALDLLKNRLNVDRIERLLFGLRRN